MSTSSGLLKKVQAGVDRVEKTCESLPVRLAVFSLLALVLAWPLLSTAGAMNMFRDAQVLDAYEHHAALTVRQFGQLPLWDPYYCGGIYSIGSPQTRHVSPTFLLSVLFGHDRGAALIVFAMIIVGLEGAFRYTRSRGASAVGALLAAPVFAASGTFATAPLLGWINFFGFQLMPWAAFGVREGLRSRFSAGAVTVVAMAWIVGFGGTYAGPLIALVCAFEAIEAAVENVRRPRAMARVLAFAVLWGGLALAAASVRVLPIAETLLAAPRVIADRPGWAWDKVWLALTGELAFRGNEISSVSGYFQIGAFMLPALLAGLFAWRAVPLLLLGGLAAWCATGYAAGWSPFIGLRALPLFSTLRYPERYLAIVALAACALAALGTTHAQRLSRRHLAGLPLLVALCALLAFNFRGMVRNHHTVDAHRTLVAPARRIDREFRQARGNRWLAAHYAPMSRGSLSCWDAWPVPQSPLLRGDLPAEEYLVEPDAGQVRRTSWSPNRIDLDVTLERPARVRINQNWHGGWRANVGTVVSEDGLLALDLPAGHHQVRVRFLPRSTIAGALGSIAAFAATAWLLRRWRGPGAAPSGRRQLGEAFGVALAPWLVTGAAWLAIPEVSIPYGTVRGPLGNLIVTTEAPAGSVPLDTRFAENVVLRAARIDKANPKPGETISIELFWERTGSIKEPAAIFVHVVGPGGAYNLDHDTVSATLSLSKLPKGRLARDLFTWTVPPSLQPGTYVVRTGLWHPGPAGGRIPVADAGRTVAEDNHVQAVSFEVGQGESPGVRIPQ